MAAGGTPLWIVTEVFVFADDAECFSRIAAVCTTAVLAGEIAQGSERAAGWFPATTDVQQQRDWGAELPPDLDDCPETEPHVYVVSRRIPQGDPDGPRHSMIGLYSTREARFRSLSMFDCHVIRVPLNRRL